MLLAAFPEPCWLDGGHHVAAKAAAGVRGRRCSVDDAFVGGAAKANGRVLLTRKGRHLATCCFDCLLHLWLVVDVSDEQHEVRRLDRSPLAWAQLEVVRLDPAGTQQRHVGIRRHLLGQPRQRLHRRHGGDSASSSGAPSSGSALAAVVTARSGDDRKGGGEDESTHLRCSMRVNDKDDVRIE